MSDRWVDTSGGDVSVAWSDVAERGFGYIVWGSILTIVSAIELVGGGVVRRLSELRDFVLVLVDAVVAIPVDGADAAASSTIEFLSLTGPLSFALAVILVSATAFALVVVTRWIVGVLIGGIA